MYIYIHALSKGGKTITNYIKIFYSDSFCLGNRTEEPARLESMGSQKVGRDLATKQ